MIPHEEVRRRLREYIYSRWPSQDAAADSLGCAQSYLCRVLLGKRPVPDWLLTEIGMKRRRVWLYEDAQ